MKTNTYGLHAHSQAAPYPYRVVAIGDTGWRVEGNGYQSSLYSTSASASAHAHTMHRHLTGGGHQYSVVPYGDDHAITEDGGPICGPMPRRAAEDTIGNLPRVRGKIDDREQLNLARSIASCKARATGKNYVVSGFPPVALPDGDPRAVFIRGAATPDRPAEPITHAIG